MHVAAIIDLLTVGGAQRLLVTYAAQRSPATAFSVITLSGRQDEAVVGTLRDLGVTIHEIPGRGLVAPVRIWRLSRLLARIRADIVHTHLTYANILGGISAALAGIPVVASLHTAGRDPRHYHPLRHRLENRALRRDGVRLVAVGRSVAEAHAGRAPGKELLTLPNPVEPVTACTPQQRAKNRHRLLGDEERFVLLSVGRLTPPKGYDVLLHAVDAVREKHPGVLLVIAGEGHMRRELENLVETLRLGQHVRLLGQRDDVPDLLGAAEVFVNSSNREGLSVAMLEAMSAGVPVVATAVGDAPALLADRRGLLVPPGAPAALSDALCCMIDDPNQGARFAAAARQYVATEHDPGNWARRMEALYAACLENRGTAKGTTS